MESSQLFGADDQEECHSSESGWTMYIGSPVQGENDDYSDPNRHVDHDGEAEEEFDDEENWETNHPHDAINSDDSMASDASSGPSLREKTWEIKNGGGRHEAKVERNHHRSNYKDKKPVKKNRHDEERNEEKEDEEEEEKAEVASKGAKFLFQGSSSKVRKNLARLGRGKQSK